MRRAVAAGAVLVGLILIGFTFTEHLFDRSSDAEKIADHYRPLMSTAGLKDLHTGFDSVKAAGAELQNNALPKLQSRLGMNAAEFNIYVRQTMPGIQTFNDQAPGVVALVEPVIGQMEAARSDYHQADQIPTGFLGLDTAPWLFLGIGGLLIALGVWGLRSPRTAVTAAIAVVGLGIALAPFVLGIPAKIDAAVRVTKLGRTGLAPTTGQKAVAATALFDGMATDTATKLEPALAAASGGRDTFGADFPALASFTTNWRSSISAQSHALSDSQVALAPTFADAVKIPLRPVPWLFIIPGILLTLLGAAALAPAWRGPGGPPGPPLPPPFALRRVLP